MHEPVGCIKHRTEHVGEYDNIEINRELPAGTKLYAEPQVAPLPELTYEMTKVACESLVNTNDQLGNLTVGDVGQALKAVWKVAAKIPRWKPIEEYNHDATVMIRAPELIDEFNPDGIGPGVLCGDVWMAPLWNNEQERFKNIEVKPTHFLAYSQL